MLLGAPVVHHDHSDIAVQLDSNSISGRTKHFSDVQLMKSVIPASEDQMTVMRVNTTKEYRKRDVEDLRFRCAKTVPGFLHMKMAAIHMIYIYHDGRSDGKDPGSLTKFIKLLGRTRVSAKCPDLNADTPETKGRGCSSSNRSKTRRTNQRNRPAEEAHRGQEACQPTNYPEQR